MRSALAAAFVSASLALSAPAEEPKRAAAPGADGWIDLMKPDVWKKVDAKWIATDAVKLAPDAKGKDDRALKAEKKDGGLIWVNGETGRLPNLVTKDAFSDCEVHIEVLLAKGSNGGIKFHEVYEIQFLDSFGKKGELSGNDMGGVYPRADSKLGYLDKGVPPKVNASKAPGEWQTLDVTWKSPRFDDKGAKTADAMIVKAVLNGQVIHENQAVKTPTGGNWERKEVASGSFMLQTDHGPTAWRNVKIKPAK